MHSPLFLQAEESVFLSPYLKKELNFRLSDCQKIEKLDSDFFSTVARGDKLPATYASFGYGRAIIIFDSKKNEKRVFRYFQVTKPTRCLFPVSYEEKNGELKIVYKNTDSIFQGVRLSDKQWFFLKEAGSNKGE